MHFSQPSTLQPFHGFDRVNVLAQRESNETTRVYFLNGPVISQQVPNNVLSSGWLTKTGKA